MNGTLLTAGVLCVFIAATASSSTGGSGPTRIVVGTSGSSTWKASLWVQLEKLSNSLWKLYRQVCNCIDRYA